MVEALLGYGADPRIKDDDGISALEGCEIPELVQKMKEIAEELTVKESAQADLSPQENIEAAQADLNQQNPIAHNGLAEMDVEILGDAQ